MPRKNDLAVIVCLLLSILLPVGCAAAPKVRPTPAGTLPGLATGPADAWEQESSQSLSATDYTLPTLPPQTETPFGGAPTAAPWTGETAPLSTEVSVPTEPTPAPPPSTETAEQIPTETPPAAETTEPPETTEAPTESEPPAPSELPIASPENIPATEAPTANEASVLNAILTEELQGLDGVWSVYAKNLKTGETVCIHDEPMVAASLIKLYVAGAYYETDLHAEDRTWCAQADVMIRASSNDACNALIDRLGMDTVNAFIRSRGDTASELNRKMLEQTDRENYITARAAGEILEDIVYARYVSPAASGRLLQNLKDQERTWKIPAGVPAGVETANKTGELSNVENDACIVWSSGGAYILCVLSNELPNVMPAREEIVRISTLVYQYFTGADN